MLAHSIARRIRRWVECGGDKARRRYETACCRCGDSIRSTALEAMLAMMMIETEIKQYVKKAMRKESEGFRSLLLKRPGLGEGQYLASQLGRGMVDR